MPTVTKKMTLAGKNLKNKEIINNLISGVYKKKPFIIKGDLLQSSDELLNLFKTFGEKNLALLYVTAEKTYETGLRESALNTNQSYLGTKIVYGILSNYFDFIKNLPQTAKNWISRGYNLSFRPFQADSVRSFFEYALKRKKSYSSNTIWGFGRFKAKKFKFISAEQKELWRRKFSYESIFYKVDSRIKNIFDNSDKYLPYFEVLADALSIRYGIDITGLPFLLQHQYEKIRPDLLPPVPDIGMVRKKEEKPAVLISLGSSPELVKFVLEARQNGCLIVTLTDDERIARISDYVLYANKGMVTEVNVLLNLLVESYNKGTKLSFSSSNAFELTKKVYKQKLNKTWRLISAHRSMVSDFSSNAKFLFQKLKNFYLRMFLNWLKSYGFITSRKWSLRRFSYYKLIWIFNSWFSNIIGFLGNQSSSKMSFLFVLFKRLMKRHKLKLNNGPKALAVRKTTGLLYDNYFANTLYRTVELNTRLFLSSKWHRRRKVKRRLRYFYIDWTQAMYTTKFANVVLEDGPSKKFDYYPDGDDTKPRVMPEVFFRKTKLYKLSEQLLEKKKKLLRRIKTQQIPWWEARKLVTFRTRKKTPTALSYNVSQNYSAMLTSRLSTKGRFRKFRRKAPEVHYTLNHARLTK